MIADGVAIVTAAVCVAVQYSETATSADKSKGAGKTLHLTSGIRIGENVRTGTFTSNFDADATGNGLRQGKLLYSHHGFFVKLLHANHPFLSDFDMAIRPGDGVESKRTHNIY